VRFFVTGVMCQPHILRGLKWIETDLMSSTTPNIEYPALLTRTSILPKTFAESISTVLAVG
jgi:hypothetical protein